MKKALFVLCCLCFGMVKAQYSCYYFSFNVVDSTGKTLRVSAQYSRTVHQKSVRFPYNKDSAMLHPLLYTKLSCGEEPYPECLSVNWGCGGDTLKRMRILIYYSNQLMTLLFNPGTSNFLLECEKNNLCISTIPFKANTILYWTGFDKDHKIVFKNVPGPK